MSLNLGIPTAIQTLGQTVNQINANFQFINDGFAINHVEYNSGADTGKHKLVQMVNNTTAFTNGANEYTFFSNSGQLKLARPGETSANALNITNVVNSTTNGFFKLVNGLTIKFGQITTTVNGYQLVSFPTGGGVPAFTGTPTIVMFSHVQLNTAPVVPRVATWVTNTTTATQVGIIVTDGAGNPSTGTFTFWALGFT